MFKKSLILSIVLCTSAHQVYAAIPGAVLEARLQAKRALLAAQRAAEEAAQQAAAHAGNMHEHVNSSEWRPGLNAEDLQRISDRSQATRGIQNGLTKTAEAFALPKVVPARPLPVPKAPQSLQVIDTTHGILGAWMLAFKQLEEHDAAHGHHDIAIPLNAFNKNHNIRCPICCCLSLEYTKDEAKSVESSPQASHAFPKPRRKPKPGFSRTLHASSSTVKGKDNRAAAESLVPDHRAGFQRKHWNPDSRRGKHPSAARRGKRGRP